MFNSNEVLNYLSDYRFAIFIRIAVQINTKAFLSVRFARELGKTGNKEIKNNAKKKDNNNREGQRNKNMIWADKSKSRSSVTLKKSTDVDSDIFLGKVPFWQRAMDGDSKGEGHE